MERLLTITDAAKQIGITEAAVRQAILKGRIPSVTKYGRKLVAAATVNDYKVTARKRMPDRSQALDWSLYSNPPIAEFEAGMRDLCVVQRPLPFLADVDMAAEAIYYAETD